MTTQSEYQLENQLLDQLKLLDYEPVNIRNEAELISNLKIQLEQANGIPTLSDSEWKQVFNQISQGNVFERATKLRNKLPIKLDDGTSRHIDLLFKEPHKNRFQVTNQVTIDPKHDNKRTYRFDVTLLVNGLPLVQIELKKRGMEMAEAFNQIQRYKRETYHTGHGLFNFIQLFIMSNGINTRYFAHSTTNDAFTFPWTDSNNKQINDISQFTSSFLALEFLTQMLNEYMVLLKDAQTLMVLRPYQIYAVKEIVEHVKQSNKNGYIWHTTGSGKTLTSFKASQIIMNMPEVEKVLFVVDRNDLDTQTAKEFNAFKADSVDSTTNTKTLIQQMNLPHDKLIVTTIQKLNHAIGKDKYSQEIEHLRHKKVVFIFDECHRSQFGETHLKIKKFFQNAQMFGFTGTPILKNNAQTKAGLKRTTEHLFNQRLHRYVIVDAIRDKNVLPFQIDYRGKYNPKTNSAHLSIDQVEGIDTQELFDDPKRLEQIAQYILDTHDTKTKKREFTAMFCVSSVDTLIKYYDIFERLQNQKQQQDVEHGRLFKPLTIATIFSYAANEAVNEDNNGLLDEENPDIPSAVNPSKRDKLDHYIEQYNQQFKTSYNSGDQFYNYYRDIASRVKKREIDILLVVNMFLTGFDSKPLNTLYVDKNLKHHGLIQAFSRTNRVFNNNKAFGNIICFRNLKQATDEALAMFSNTDTPQVVLVPEFSEIKQQYDSAVQKLQELTPDCQDVDNLLTENDQLEFIKAFREVMRANGQLETFIEYDQNKTALDKQSFADFASKYKDLCHQVRRTSTKEKVSILDEVDFQLDLLHSDRINVGYIINLLQLAINNPDLEKRQQYQAQVSDLIEGEVSLHDKQDLIKKFIDQNIPKLITGQNVQDAFKVFWDIEKEQAYQHLCEQENIDSDEFKKVLQRYEFTQRLPERNDILKLPTTAPKLRERQSVLNHLVGKTKAFIEKFYRGIS